MERPKPEIPDLRERGGVRDGAPQFSDRRLYMQLQVFTTPVHQHQSGAEGLGVGTAALAASLRETGLETVLYQSVLDPRGYGVLVLTEDPALLVGAWRDLFNHAPWSGLVHLPQFTMMGRTYSLGYEPDLDDTLLHRPRRTASNPAWPWAVWYPLRRKGAFAALPAEQQCDILMEHGKLGFSFGAGDLAHDIRLACYGLDAQDNDFVVGLVGKELYPLSAVVQAMRKTQQTSLYLEHLGPFFVGRAVREG